MQCPCGQKAQYTDCCEPYILGKAHAPTAEALMRSRYTAYATGAVAYLKETLAPEARGDYDEKAVKEWATQSEWLGLEILSAGTDKVEFVAKYRSGGKGYEHHETSRFKKRGDRWFFVDGDSHVHEEGQGHHHHEPKKPTVRTEPKIGRNDPCHCGSGKKFKKCHG